LRNWNVTKFTGLVEFGIVYPLMMSIPVSDFGFRRYSASNFPKSDFFEVEYLRMGDRERINISHGVVP